MEDVSNDDERYFSVLACAFVRGRLPELTHLPDDELLAQGKAQGLRLHKFKRNTDLPRVKRILGILQALQPASLLDLGSGRGTFLWPLLDAFPDLMVTALDVSEQRVSDLDAVRRGGVANLRAVQMDATSIALPDKSVDLVTALEVLEHLEQPQLAAREAVRLAQRFVLVSVPSKPDDNPEHIQLFTAQTMTALLTEAGARSVKTEYVLNHLIAVARV
jgi:ubiquinone/menaquinone biosynthesis C-methylase UbiE